MAISVITGDAGTATEKVSDQTLTLTPSVTLEAGNWGLLGVVIDNTGTAEGETNDLSVTDSVGNTWVKLREQTESNTTALTGVTCALFLAKMVTQLTAADTISIALAANSTAKGAALAELGAADGFNIILSVGGANGTNAAGATSYSVALSGLTNVAGMYVGLSASEGEANADVTRDAAYTGIFANFGSGTAGIGTSNVIASAGRLLNTSTGDTYDNTGLNSADRATILVRLEEVSAGAMINAQPGSYAVAGTAAGSVAGRMVSASPGAYTLTGIAASVPAGRAVDANPGAYTLTGFAASLVADRVLSAVPGVYALTGQDAALVAGRILAADPGAYVITGFAAELVTVGAFMLAADPGSYSLTGQPTGMLAARIIVASPGTIIVSGQNAGLVTARVLQASPGSYALTGLAAELALQGVFILSADPGSYALNGASAGLVAARIVVADPGAFVLTGEDAGLIADRLVAALPGAYVLAGVSATLFAGIPEIILWPDAIAPHFGEEAQGRILSPELPEVQ